MIADLRDRHRERKHFARAAFVRTTGVSVIPSTLQRLHGFGYNGIVRIHLSTWLVLKLEGSVHSVPRDVTLPSLDIFSPAQDARAGERHQLVATRWMNRSVIVPSRPLKVNRARSSERVLTPLSGILGTRSVGKPAMKLWRR